jgi:putative peptidoglycan lipid II flippase
MNLGDRLARAAGVVLVMNLASRALGFIRDAVIANAFGATSATDAYLVAYTLPYALQAVLGVAFVTVIVPVLTPYLIQGRQQEGWRVASAVLTLTTLVLVVITLLGILFAPVLARMMAPGFSPSLLSLTTQLTRIMFPSLVFMGIGMLVSGMLNAGQRFSMAAFAPAFANIIVILSVVLFAAAYRVQGLAVGTVVGFIGFLVVQIPGLRALGFRYRVRCHYSHPVVRQVFINMVPVILAVSVNQIYLVLNRVFASGLATGSITTLDMANRIMNLPLGIFVAAVSTAIFPTLAEQVVLKDTAALSRTIIKALGMGSLAAVPAAVGLIVLREPLVRLLLERGAFTQEATLLTATALFYFALGLPGLAANLVLTRAYYALGDVTTPVLTGIISIGLNIVLSLLFLPVLRHGGLALANSLAATVDGVMLYSLLRRHLPDLKGRLVVGPLVKITAAALVMGVITAAGVKVLGNILQTGHLFYLMIQVGVAALLGLAVFLGAAWLLRVEEISLVTGLVRRQLGRAAVGAGK